MIQSLLVRGLNGKFDLDLKFNEDINLLTGKNGSSKTTLLKLIWFLNGGQLSHLLNEVNFVYAEITTSKYKAVIERESDKGVVKFQLNDQNPQTFAEDQARRSGWMLPTRLRRSAQEFNQFSVPTIFFPTFRRIEGGFTMDGARSEGPYDTSMIKTALTQLSNSLSKNNQRFVASISTDDLVSLITKEYAAITQIINTIQQRHSELIINKIKSRIENADALLESIQKEIEETEKTRLDLFKPFTVLAELVKSIFQYKGIALSTQTLGEVGDAIASDKLSAGEKQMLSFLCYNTFTKNSSIFIDEPELSLHPDWQRMLVPTLLDQGNNNQFFMATHSPFIYAKYPDKEIMLGNDRGGN